MKNLVIVESPTKAKTIAKFLGNDFKITSSYGHVRDLPAKKMGVKPENYFEPEYTVSKDKKPIVDNLKKMAKGADMIYFATDEDREGEAISWHLEQILEAGKKKMPYKRIAFHEITKNAVLEALKHPREIDEDLVNAQQARRILDRLVGYKLSPFLWKKVAKGLSAGRVQSVAVRLVVEREEEIKKFQAEEYWTLKALLKTERGEELGANLIKIDNKKLEKLELKDKKTIEEILENLRGAEYLVVKIEKKETIKNQPAPFTTSTLQQEAHNKLGFSARQTMYLAQGLYEGVKIGKEQTGLITYMRTDSLNLSSSFVAGARDYIKEELGEKYLPEKSHYYKTKAKGAQEAHEAIRPTDAFATPEKLKDYLDDKQYKIYNLIWSRALASQMKAARVENTSADIGAKKYVFRATGNVIKFPGWLKVYGSGKENELPGLKEKEKLILQKLEPKQSFTEPPARYNDASLVKKLEELGIGRPSTYAPIISTIQERNYIKRESGRFIPQDIALVVTDLLKQHFPEIVDYQFTAEMEEGLDEVAEGKKKWVPLLRDFYDPFEKNLEKKYMEIKKLDVMEAEETGELCEKCGSPMVMRTSRFGKFLACSAFPKCRNTKQVAGNNQAPGGGNKITSEGMPKPEPEMTDIKCEKCGAPMLIRQGRFGKFLACSAFPKCKNTKPLDQDTGVDCPQCGKGKIVAKKTKTKKTFYACDQYPKCKFALWARPSGNKCPKCGSLMINAGNNEEKCSNKDCE
ncbi:MAG TPA: type I DNA topoisomerase [bacterium]|nr:type I DNA topoisomerase [bacterium]